jgi:SAM-dependent methyltransferase
VDDSYSAFYRRLYENHWWFRMRERWVLQLLRKFQPPSGWNPILDIGCGDALFFDRLAEFGEVEGVEYSREIVNPANPHFQKIYIGAFDDSFQPGKQYSLLLLLDVLEHLPDPAGALRRCRALLRPGGSLFITVPAFNVVWTNHDAINHHMTRYRRATLFPLLQGAGLAIKDSGYWFHWTFPVKFAQHWIEKIFRLQPANPAIPSPAVNRLLCCLCSADQALLGPLHLPFGTTLYVRCE